ncbi:hypothetical protein [Kocuria sp. TGY1127_2]|uniref:hypothetical protein n=1 Tax=Kocuria sp. TGY1127_2 TaxID=2711328 RepID=UPI0015BD84FF|nr:hypothetical protein [Kocuria sp. TGY1127_2]
MKAPSMTVTAEDKKTGLTLGELSKFVSWAYAQGSTDTTTVRVTVGFNSNIKTISTRQDN